MTIGNIGRMSSVPEGSTANPQVKSNTGKDVRNTTEAVVASKPATPVVDASASQPEVKDIGIDLAAALDKLREYAKSYNRQLEFHTDKDTGRTVVKITNPTTNEVVRQIPSEEVLRMVKNIENARGIIFEDQA